MSAFNTIIQFKFKTVSWEYFQVLLLYFQIFFFRKHSLSGERTEEIFAHCVYDATSSFTSWDKVGLCLSLDLKSGQNS